ncbi:hypothetical protein ET475_02590 [Microbacterium protaetiae]|uniref:Uncharacterized protein n=1 Tax=Microbacterium protaetiae TaxID=2509458 RepID=A0A4P6EA30_9MICO|nr:hypothetical protein ET475_02590 [Microbacterium protaetiae]
MVVLAPKQGIPRETRGEALDLGGNPLSRRFRRLRRFRRAPRPRRLRRARRPRRPRRVRLSGGRRAPASHPPVLVGGAARRAVTRLLDRLLRLGQILQVAPGGHA